MPLVSSPLRRPLSISHTHSSNLSSGQLFSRPEHVLRHRARNICPAGLDRPGEPKRKTAGGTVPKAKQSNGARDTSLGPSRAATLTPSFTPGSASSITRRAAAGSRAGTQLDPSKQVKTANGTSSPRYRCEWYIFISVSSLLPV